MGSATNIVPTGKSSTIRFQGKWCEEKLKAFHYFNSHNSSSFNEHIFKNMA